MCLTAPAYPEICLGLNPPHDGAENSASSGTIVSGRNSLARQAVIDRWLVFCLRRLLAIAPGDLFFGKLLLAEHFGRVFEIQNDRFLIGKDPGRHAGNPQPDILVLLTP